VDTHVERVSKRLGFCRWKDSVLEVEKTLMKKVPEEEWSVTHHLRQNQPQSSRQKTDERPVQQKSIPFYNWLEQ
ncbi:hypothetical protein ACQCVI_26005, partial [Bacillus infantis]